jgi:[ribosomal protein S5]-alanine N-acetyltransferase
MDLAMAPLLSPVFPILSTARLRLRDMRQDDRIAYAALLTDGEEACFTTDMRIAEDLVPARIERNRLAFAERRALYWSVTRNDEFVGFVALHSMAYEAPALSYAISRPSRRKGIATEAVSRVVDYALGELDASCLVASTHVENVPSAQLLRSLRFRDEGIAVSANGLRRHFRLRSEQWLGQRGPAWS